jgi:hypothetical protein
LIAASLLLALFVGGCSSAGGDLPGAASTSSSGYGGSMSLTDFFAGSSARSPQTVAGAQPDVNCPPVDVRQGASTLIIGPSGGNRAAMSLKYQGAFTREARECSVAGDSMVMRIGVQGRVVVGPAGGPGQVDVPLRIAVVQETPGGARPVMTKFVRIPVTVGTTDSAVFSHIEEGLSFPLPTPKSALDDYIVYIGFDPLSAQAQDQQLAKEPRQPRRPKPRPPLRPPPSAN